MISFKGAHFPKDVILYAVFFYVRYGVSYRDLEEIMGEMGVKVDNSTLNRGVIQYSSSLALAAKKLKRAVATSWRMDETYVKVKGQWVYLYRAVDKFGGTVYFMLSEQRDEMAATTFFKQAINNNGFPLKLLWIKAALTMLALRISIGY
jgi:putative transposase